MLRIHWIDVHIYRLYITLKYIPHVPFWCPKPICQISSFFCLSNMYVSKSVSVFFITVAPIHPLSNRCWLWVTLIQPLKGSCDPLHLSNYLQWYDFCFLFWNGEINIKQLKRVAKSSSWLYIPFCRRAALLNVPLQLVHGGQDVDHLLHVDAPAAVHVIHPRHTIAKWIRYVKSFFFLNKKTNTNVLDIFWSRTYQ